MHPSDYAGQEFKYIVMYRTDDQSDNDEPFTEVEVDPDQTTYNVNSEKDFQLYEVKVISKNQEGRSETKPKLVNGMSGESGMFSILILEIDKHFQYCIHANRCPGCLDESFRMGA